MAEPQRLETLDVLRTVAVALVVFDHWGLAYPDNAVAKRADTAGWLGVDLFFVLSGFLVSGLIFREHQRHGVVDTRRFLIRRGLKIYPAFYVFLAVSVLFADELLFGDTYLNPATRGSFGSGTLAETLFVQNYADGLWPHTWTLAVEEHFYLLLALYAGVASRRGWMPRDARSAAIRIGALCAMCLCLRVATALFVDFDWERWWAPTHLRMDSLLVGVLLSFLYHHERTALERFVLGHRAALVAASGLLVMPAVLFERSRKLNYAFGHTSLAAGFGLLIVLMLTSARTESLLRTRPWSALCIAGRYSYSVYLWHIAVIIMIDRVLRRVAPGTSMGIRLVLDLTLSFAVGIVVARLVELPVLRLRDRIYPSRSGGLDADRHRSAPAPSRDRLATRPSPDDRRIT